MYNDPDSLQHLSGLAQQEIMNAGFYRMLEEQGGEFTLQWSALKPDDMGGIAIEANPEDNTITFRAVNSESMAAWRESLDNVKQ